MITDNCPIQPTTKNLKSITLSFLPTYTAYTPQPTGQGGHILIEVQVTRLIYSENYTAIDHGKELPFISIPKAMVTVFLSRGKVPVIANVDSFSRAGFKEVLQWWGKLWQAKKFFRKFQISRKWRKKSKNTSVVQRKKRKEQKRCKNTKEKQEQWAWLLKRFVNFLMFTEGGENAAIGMKAWILIYNIYDFSSPVSPTDQKLQFTTKIVNENS